MTTPPEQHNTSVRIASEGNVASCTCGWTAAPTTVPGKAEAQADAHRAANR